MTTDPPCFRVCPPWWTNEHHHDLDDDKFWREFRLSERLRQVRAQQWGAATCGVFIGELSMLIWLGIFALLGGH